MYLLFWSVWDANMSNSLEFRQKLHSKVESIYGPQASRDTVSVSFFLIHPWIGVGASVISTTLQVAYLFMFTWHDFPPPRVVRAASKPKLFSVKILQKKANISQQAEKNDRFDSHGSEHGLAKLLAGSGWPSRSVLLWLILILQISLDVTPVSRLLGWEETRSA